MLTKWGSARAASTRPVRVARHPAGDKRRVCLLPAPVRRDAALPTSDFLESHSIRHNADRVRVVVEHLPAVTTVDVAGCPVKFPDRAIRLHLIDRAGARREFKRTGVIVKHHPARATVSAAWRSGEYPSRTVAVQFIQPAAGVDSGGFRVVVDFRPAGTRVPGAGCAGVLPYRPLYLQLEQAGDSNRYLPSIDIVVDQLPAGTRVALAGRSGIKPERAVVVQLTQDVRAGGDGDRTRVVVEFLPTGTRAAAAGRS